MPLRKEGWCSAAKIKHGREWSSGSESGSEVRDLEFQGLDVSRYRPTQNVSPPNSLSSEGTCTSAVQLNGPAEPLSRSRSHPSPSRATLQNEENITRNDSDCILWVASRPTRGAARARFQLGSA